MDSIVPIGLQDRYRGLPNPPKPGGFRYDNLVPDGNSADVLNAYDPSFDELFGPYGDLKLPITPQTTAPHVAQPPPPPSDRSVSPEPSPQPSEDISSTMDSDNAEIIIPRYTGPLPDSYWDLTEIQIASISFKEFTKLMTKSKLSEKEIAEAKRVRRRVKNRHSARLCSSRKREKCMTTETENEGLQRRVRELQRENEQLLNQHMLLQERCIELQKADADHVRETAYLQAELQKMRDLVQMATNDNSDFGSLSAVNMYAQAA